MASSRKNAATLAYERKCQARYRRNSMVFGLVLGFTTLSILWYATSGSANKPMIFEDASQVDVSARHLVNPIAMYADGNTEAVDQHVDEQSSSR